MPLTTVQVRLRALQQAADEGRLKALHHGMESYAVATAWLACLFVRTERCIAARSKLTECVIEMDATHVRRPPSSGLAPDDPLQPLPSRPTHEHFTVHFCPGSEHPRPDPTALTRRPGAATSQRRELAAYGSVLTGTILPELLALLSTLREEVFQLEKDIGVQEVSVRTAKGVVRPAGSETAEARLLCRCHR